MIITDIFGRRWSRLEHANGTIEIDPLNGSPVLVEYWGAMGWRVVHFPIERARGRGSTCEAAVRKVVVRRGSEIEAMLLAAQLIQADEAMWPQWAAG